MKLKLMVPVLAVAAALAAPGAAFAADWTAEHFTWSTTAEGGVQVAGLTQEGFDNLQDNKDLVIPAVNEEGNPVVSIGNMAFSAGGGTTYTDDQKALLKTVGSVSMPDTISEIGTAAFNTSNGLTRVHLSEALTAIPAGAFLKNDTSAPALEEVVIPSKVTSIGASAFAGCKVSKLSMPEGLSVINGSAFLNHQLSKVTLPSSVTSVGSSAFSVARPDLPKTLVEINLNEGLLKVDATAFGYCADQVVEIPSSVTTLNKKAFYGSVNGVTALVSTASQLAGTKSFPVTNLSGHVVKGNLSKAVIAAIDDVTATGVALEPEVSVTFDGQTVDASQLILTYENNVLPGTATVKVEAAAEGSYAGAVSAEFKIVASAEDRAACEELVAQVQNMPALDQITAEDPEALATAEATIAAFNSLTDFQKQLVPSATALKLVSAQGKISQVKQEIAQAAVKEAAEAQARAEAEAKAAAEAAAKAEAEAKAAAEVAAKAEAEAKAAAEAKAKAEAEAKAAAAEKAKLAAALAEANKPVQGIRVKVAKKYYKVKTVKSASRSFYIRASSNTGSKLTYKVCSCSSKLTFKNGKVTVKKGTKAGTYRVKLKITAAAKGKYRKTVNYRYITVKVVK